MRGVAMKTILAAAIAGSSLFVAAQASAHDYDRWDRWEHKHHWKHSRDWDRPSRVIVERPVYVAQPVRPVYVAPVAPMVPMAPAYGYGGGGYNQDPSVNFNFSFPMR